MDSNKKTFDPAHASVIREAFRRGEEVLSCPICYAEMKCEPFAGGGTIAPVYEVGCAACGLVTYAARGR